MALVDDGVVPVYPDRFPPPRGRGFVVMVGPISPLPNAPPPTELTWHPTYPDWLARPKRLLAQRSYFRLDGVPFIDVRWRGTYPERIHRLRFLATWQLAYTAPDPSILRVPVIQQWRPTYPLILRRARTAPPTQTVYPIQGTTIISAATCVEWDEVTVIRPEFDAEGVGRPSMTCDVHDAGFLLLEDGGFLLLEDGGKILLEDQTGCTQEAVGRSMFDEEAIC